jgi:predicted peroxiredoxin
MSSPHDREAGRIVPGQWQDCHFRVRPPAPILVRRRELMDARDLIVMVTRGTDHELSSVAFTIANGGITNGLRVSVFLTSAGVDLVRKRALATTHVQPLDPLDKLVRDFLGRGGAVWACTPCVKARGYTESDLIEGVVISGAGPMLEKLKAGAATLSF